MKRNIKILLFLILGAACFAVAIILNDDFVHMPRAFLICGVILVCDALIDFAVAAIKKKKRAGAEHLESDEKELPEYRRKKAMLTNAERKFYLILKELFGDKYDVLYQVPLCAVIDKLTQNSYRNELFRVADFCLASKADFAPLLLIELNDSSHLRADRIERDKKVAQICSRAKMPIVAFKTNEISDYAYIKRIVKSNIAKN